MNIVGISFDYHDAAAALVVDGRIAAAVEEERFSRKKHDSGFPRQAIDYCIQSANLKPADVDYFVFYEKPIRKFDRVMTTLLAEHPGTWKSFLRAVPVWIKRRLWVESEICEKLEVSSDKVLFSQHHLSHAASAYYASGFASAAVLTLDGIGEWSSGTVGWGEGRMLRIDREMRFPHSIGLFYSLVTAYLGFKVNDGEWKVMGLAPYGSAKYAEKLREIVGIFADGSVQLNSEYIDFLRSDSRMFVPQKMEALLGIPPRSPAAELGPEHADLAASVQRIFEDCLVRSIQFAAAQYNTDRLCYAGGTALNSVANRLILTQTPMREVFIQPAPGDDGAAIGAALLAYNYLCQQPKRCELRDVFLGPEFDDHEIAAACAEAGLDAECMTTSAELLERTVDLILAGKVVGWFQGRMEFGPRALGSRSILADPRRAEMKEIINAKVKYRESFRPFAGSVPVDQGLQYFALPCESSLFMLIVCPVRDEWQEKLAAITHVDGSCRIQTVERHSAPLYFDLLNRFGARSGIPVLLNTSFNIRGEPIVCTPSEAIQCFLRTGLDALVIGSHIIEAKNNAVPYDFEAVARMDMHS